MPGHSVSEDEREPLLVANEALSQDHFRTTDSFPATDTEQGRAETSKDVDARPSEYDWGAVAMMASTWLGVILASMDASVMATLTGPISESFESFELLSWFINAYTISAATLQPLSGKLSDIFGRRPVLVVGELRFLTWESRMWSSSEEMAIHPQPSNSRPWRRTYPFNLNLPHF